MHFHNFFWGKSVVTWWLPTVRRSTDWHGQCAWKRDQTSNQNTGLEMSFGVDQRPLKLCFAGAVVTLQLTGLSILSERLCPQWRWPLQPHPWLSSDLTHREICSCPAASWILEKALVWARVELEKLKSCLTGGTAQEQVQFYRESFTTFWVVTLQGWLRANGAVYPPGTHFVPPALLLAGTRAGYVQRWTYWSW